MPTTYQLGPWHIMPQLCQIRHTSTAEEIHLQPKVMEVLVLLCEHPQQLVSRDTFFTQVWGGKNRVDEVLTGSISELRKVLKDNKLAPMYIKTIHKKGYVLLQTPVQTQAKVSVRQTSAFNVPPQLLPTILTSGKRIATSFCVIASFAFYTTVQHNASSTQPLAMEPKLQPHISQPEDAVWGVANAQYQYNDKGYLTSSYHPENRELYRNTQQTGCSSLRDAPTRDTSVYSTAI